MLSKKQLLVTAASMITGSFIINLLWIINKRYEDAKPGTPLNMVVVYLLIVAAGVLAAATQNRKTISDKSLTLINCVATTNLCLGITGSILMYFDNGSRFTTKILLLLIPFFIGVLLFEKVFFLQEIKTKRPE